MPCALGRQALGAIQAVQGFTSAKQKWTQQYSGFFHITILHGNNGLTWHECKREELLHLVWVLGESYVKWWTQRARRPGQTGLTSPIAGQSARGVRASHRDQLQSAVLELSEFTAQQ